jgi:hypothetical protein
MRLRYQPNKNLSVMHRTARWWRVTNARISSPDGVLVEFCLTPEESGVPCLLEVRVPINESVYVDETDLATSIALRRNVG